MTMATDNSTDTSTDSPPAPTPAAPTFSWEAFDAAALAPEVQPVRGRAAAVTAVSLRNVPIPATGQVFAIPAIALTGGKDHGADAVKLRRRAAALCKTYNDLWRGEGKRGKPETMRPLHAYLTTRDGALMIAVKNADGVSGNPVAAVPATATPATDSNIPETTEADNQNSPVDGGSQDTASLMQAAFPDAAPATATPTPPTTGRRVVSTGVPAGVPAGVN